MKKIDVRGLSCPQPVVVVQREIKEGKNNFEVLLDSEASKENIIRLLAKNKLESEVVEDNENIVCRVFR